MKKVLIFTYYWPPAGGPGVQRYLKFCKYLREFGWEPIIITVQNGSYPYTDESLAADIPQGIQVIKTKTLEPFEIYNRLQGKRGKTVGVGMTGYRDSQSIVQKISKYVRANFFIPDARKFWKKYALAAAKKVMAENQIEVVITTGPPHSTHLIGLELKRKLSIPWVADFRDPWTTVYYNKFFPRTKRTKRIDQRLENSVLINSDCIITVSHGMKNEYIGRAPNTKVIYNGFDQVDIPEYNPKPSSEFTLSYIGNFKPNQNVSALWEAVVELASELTDFKQNFRLRLTGGLDTFVRSELEEKLPGEVLEMENFVAHQEATKRMLNSSMLLFVIPDSETKKAIVTGKVFEYIASRTPILAIGPPDGDAAQILLQAGRDAMLDYGEKELIKSQILKYYNHWLQNKKVATKHDKGEIEQFSRRSLTGQLAGILNQIT